MSAPGFPGPARLRDRLATLVPPRELGPRAERRLVVGLTLGAFALRAVGVSSGLPEVYHDDTPKQLYRVPLFLRGELIPGDTYPTLHMYVVALLLRVLIWFEPHLWEGGPSLVQVAVTARLLNAALGAGLVPLAYLVGRWLFDRMVGVLGAALVALSGLAIVHAHYAMGDVIQSFFVTAAVAAATRVLLTGHPAAFLLAGACTGCAISAKYYGGVAGAAVAVAALVSPRVTWTRALLLTPLAGLAAGAAFVLTTPKLLLTPREFIRAFPEALETIPPPPLLERPLVAARALAGVGLEWLDPLLLAAAAVGIAALLHAGRRGLVLLATPAFTLTVYVLFRAHRVDDRLLLLLVPFLALAAAVAVGGLGRWGRLGPPAAAAAAAVLLAAALVDALSVAYLFREDDTRVFAARWAATRVEPDAAVLEGALLDSVAQYRATGADLLQLDSHHYERYVTWFSIFRAPHAERALALLETEGKLLARFELWPRAFTAPTIVYYDLASWEVPYAFPPPDDVARPEPLVFVEPRAVPARASLAVARGGSAATTLVARDPLARLGIALAGVGRVRVHQGWRTARVRLHPRELTVVFLEPWRSFPWFKRFYPLRVEARDGWVVGRLLLTPCDVADAHLAYRAWAEAIPHLEACAGTAWVEPARLLKLARAYAELGQTAAARRALADLAATAPGLLAALRDLAAQPDGPAWRERYRRMAGHGRTFWPAHRFTIQAEAARLQVGHVAAAEGAGGDHVLRIEPGRAEPDPQLKVWFPQDFLRGRYQVTFRLRSAAGRPLATLDVVRHFQRQVHDVPARRQWHASGPGGFQEVMLPVATDLEPVGFEARVHVRGGGALEVDEITIVPDVRAALRETLEPLASLLAPRNAGPPPTPARAR